jgi:hypothetical protein
MQRLTGFPAVFMVALAAAIVTPLATAAQPDKFDGTFSFTSVLTDVCPFDVTLDASGTFTEIDFFDESGTLTRVHIHTVEQDTFSANGKSLTGLPFAFNVDILFDSSGDVTHLFANGLVEKVPLPDGRLFISSGRLDFAAHGFPDFLITPDVGATVNLAGFCAALSP